MKRKWNRLVWLMCFSVLLTACGAKEEDTEIFDKETTVIEETEKEKKEETKEEETGAQEEKSEYNNTNSDAYEPLELTAEELEVNKLGGTGKQFDLPTDGDTVVELKIKNYGSIYVRFFPEVAPKAVENFITHAKDGYYDNVLFHRVINEFMIQGGDPTATGMSGESIWGADFEDEFSPEFFPFRGSLCMANAGPKTNGSQFFLVQAGSVAPEIIDKMGEDAQYSYTTITEEAKENYVAIGGTPWLHNKHTVFGQIILGYDVLDKIAATPVGDSDVPIEEVMIEKANVYKFKTQ